MNPEITVCSKFHDFIVKNCEISANPLTKKSVWNILPQVEMVFTHSMRNSCSSYNPAFRTCIKVLLLTLGFLARWSSSDQWWVELPSIIPTSCGFCMFLKQKEIITDAIQHETAYDLHVGQNPCIPKTTTTRSEKNTAMWCKSLQALLVSIVAKLTNMKGHQK